MIKVLIVGAGPTGLTTALEFARQGVMPEIVDAKDMPSWKSRAVAILPRSIEILNRTGVGRRIVDEGMYITRARIHRGNRALLDVDISSVLPKDESIIGLAQNRTETLMSEELERMDVSVRYGVRVTSVITSEKSADVVFEGGKKETYDWVVGADGVNSTVRTSLNIPHKGYELDEEWSIADVDVSKEIEHNTINAWLLKGEHKTRDAMVMVPIEQKRIRLISSTPDSLKALPIHIEVENVRRTGVFKISVRQASRYVEGRVVLAGDAAHAHSPVGGRGMNLGIEDGQAAVSAILHGTVKEYEIERKEKAARVIRGTERARKLVVSNNPFTVFGIYLGAWCIQHIGFIRRRFVKNIATL